MTTTRQTATSDITQREVSPALVYGLDLSLTSTGLATLGRTRRLQPPAKLRGPARLDWILAGIWALVIEPLPQLVAIEGYAFGRPQGATAAGELHGLVTWNLWRQGIPYVEVPPASVKKYATGRGNADKDQVLVAACRRITGFDGGNDEADAAWLWAMACDALGVPVVQVPAVHRAALVKVPWPVAP